MADKHKGTPANFILARKFTHCWMIRILIPPCKDSWWTLGFLPLPHSCTVPHRGVTDSVRAEQLHSRVLCDGKIKSATERQPLCHKQSC